MATAMSRRDFQAGCRAIQTCTIVSATLATVSPVITHVSQTITFVCLALSLRILAAIAILVLADPAPVLVAVDQIRYSLRDIQDRVINHHAIKFVCVVHRCLSLRDESEIATREIALAVLTTRPAGRSHPKRRSPVPRLGPSIPYGHLDA
jgi:hypothetical protein